MQTGIKTAAGGAMRIITLVLVIAFFTACESDNGSPTTGAQNGDCYPNGTCNDGLECVSDICVKPTTTLDVVEEADARPNDVFSQSDDQENDVGLDGHAADTNVGPDMGVETLWNDGQDDSSPVDTQPTFECLTDQVCAVDADCDQGERCNTALELPACQTLYCATDSQACDPVHGDLLCAPGLVCIDSPLPVCCAPKCDAMECGPDGCGGSCGNCGECGTECISGACVFTACSDKQCGEDGCGASCGECGCGQTCSSGQCAFIGCDDKECGSDGCGGSCGECALGEACGNGVCVCQPTCNGKQCGDNGCGGKCGTCPSAEICTAESLCVAASPDEGISIVVDEGQEVIPQTTLHLSVDAYWWEHGPATEYEWSVEQPTFSTSTFSPDISSQNPTFEANVAGKYVFNLKVRNSVGVSAIGPPVEVLVVPDEAIHIELLWTSPGDPDPFDEGPLIGTDLDLHFAHPSASQYDLDGDGNKDPWFDPKWDTFWYYPLQNWGSITSNEDNPSLDRDDVDTNGPENLNLDVPEQNKSYAIGVNYWDDHGFGASFAAVRVYVYAQLVFEVTDVAMYDHDMWWVGTIDWPSGQVNAKLKQDGSYWITHDYHHPQFYQP